MPTERKKTEIHRAMTRKKMGAIAKAKRENGGTTVSIPLTGAPMPTLRYGRAVKADSIVVPKKK